MIDRAINNPRKNPQYAYIAPNYGQAKRVVWDYLKDYTKDFPGVVVNEAELRVDFPRPSQKDRIRFMLLGAENPGSIRGIYLDGGILDEPAEMDPTVFSQVIRPALSDRLGWCIFIGTFKGQNHFWHIYTRAKARIDWFTAIFRASETNIIPKAELEAAKAMMSEEEYAQEFECDPRAAIVGAYFGKQMTEAEMDGRVCDVPYDKALPVHTWWDLGKTDATSIWFIQHTAGAHRVIDYYENQGEDLPHYADLITNKPYKYAKYHNLPHDGAAMVLGMDRTRQQTLLNNGIATIVHPRHRLQDQINATRVVLSKCYFDEKKTEAGRNALSNYQCKYDNVNKVYLAIPLHNWASHGASAFMGFSMMDRIDRKNVADLPKFADNEYDPLDY